MKTKTCKYCFSIIPKNNRTCPVCNKKQELPGWSQFFIIIIGVALINAMINPSKNSPTSSSVQSKNFSPLWDGPTIAHQNKLEEICKTPTPTHNVPSSQEAPTPQEVLSFVKLKHTWSKAAFGNVMEANFTIENSSKYDIKDIEIKCTLHAKSGTVLGSNNRIVYEIVKSHGKKKITGFNMGFINPQSNTASCEIIGLMVD